MKLLKINEIECVSGGLEGQLEASFLYKTPYGEEPSIYCEFFITGPADEVLAKIASRDYPVHLEGLPNCKLSSIEICTA